LAQAAMGDETSAQPTHVLELFRAWQAALGRYRDADPDSQERQTILREVNRRSAAYQKALLLSDGDDGPG
jgi:hypothetical protein